MALCAKGEIVTYLAWPEQGGVGAWSWCLLQVFRGEGDDLIDGTTVCQEHDEAVDTESDPCGLPVVAS